jgi:carboxymethylenebutenolidase
VPKIKAAILVNHGALDRNLMMAWPAQEAELKRNNIRYEGRIYPDSVHGFFNDATPERYNKVTAAEAWMRTVGWFNQHVRQPTA